MDVTSTHRSWRSRLALGLASSAMSQALAGAQAFVLVPLFVSAWDPDQYGRWLVLSAIASHLAIADLGGQNYVANVLAMHFGRGEEAEFRDRLSEAVSLFLLIGLGLFALLLLGLLWAAWVPVGLDRPLLTAGEALALLFLGALAVVMVVPGGVYATVYRASGLFARAAVVGNVGRVAHVAGCLVLLMAKASPAAVAGWILLSGTATTAAIVVDTRRVIPACRDIRLGIGLAVRGARRFAVGSLHFWVITIANEVNQQGLLLVIAAVASPVAVAVYATHRILASIPSRLATLAQDPVIPELSFLWARRQHGDLVRVSLLATTTVMAMGAVAAAAIWVVAPLGYAVWTSHNLSFDVMLALTLLVQSILASGWQTSAWSLLATNQHHALAWWSAARAALTVGLAWPLAGAFGPLGVAAAGLAADVACGAVMFPASVSATLGMPAVRIYRRLALGLVPLLPLAVSAFRTSTSGAPPELTGLTAAALFSGALALGVASPSMLPVMRALQVKRSA